MSTSGAACPVCGGSCTSFPQTPHAADYPFLPGGVTPMSDEKLHTATGRMFDESGALAAIAGDKVSASVWKNLTAESDFPADEYSRLSAEQVAAEASKKRAPARETR